MVVRPCTPADLPQWIALRAALWPGEAGLGDEAAAMLDNPDLLNLIARAGDGSAAGFAEASIRRDYVNGCETSPVAFLEGIYVAPRHRGRGVARSLVAHVAHWGRAKGCAELASDALADNRASHDFHAAIGFAETERVVYFRRAL